MVVLVKDQTFPSGCRNWAAMRGTTVRGGTPIRGRGRGGSYMRGGMRGVITNVRGNVRGAMAPRGMRGSSMRGAQNRNIQVPRGGYRGRGAVRGHNNTTPAVSPWKLQCFFCTDTVSTGKLNKNYYKLHLEVGNLKIFLASEYLLKVFNVQAVHNISLNCDKLLNYSLDQQNVSEPTVSAVANILSMKVGAI